MAQEDTLELTWYGHAMFGVTGGGMTVVVDPVPPEVGYVNDPVAADVVLISHSHFDHGYVDGVTGDPRIITASGTFEHGNLRFTGIESFHDSSSGGERGPNVIFTWEQAGLRLAHLGDLGDVPGPEAMAALRGLDLLMIPVGGVFTINGKRAAELLRGLAPSIAVPMHYRTADCNIPIDPVAEFTARFDGAVREIDERPLKISRGSLPAETEAWLLGYK